MDTVLIGCGTLEDEIHKVLAEIAKPPRLIFTEAALHDKPTEQMRQSLQRQLDAIGPEVRQVLLAYGLCGGATTGLATGDFTLIIPKADDCIPLLIGSREKAAKASEVPSFFLTAGWLKFSNQCYYSTLARMGERKTAMVYQMMLANYKRFLFIDTGAYDLAQARAAMAERIERHGLPADEVPGDLTWLRQLITGPWPQQEFLTVSPYSQVQWER